MSREEALTLALTRWAGKMAQSLRLQADAFDTLAGVLQQTDATANWEPASELPLSERPRRQAFLLAAVQMKTKSLGTRGIPRSVWLQLAEQFGYDTRGTAGFFRRSPDGSPGLLTMEGENVKLAPAGRRRIDEFKAAIRQHDAEIKASTEVI